MAILLESVVLPHPSLATGGAAQTLGLVTAAPAVGGIVGSALSGSVGHVSRRGRAMLVAGAAWGAGLAGFGLARSLGLALALLALAGAADVIAVVFRTTMVQVATPDRLRGRVSAAESVVGAGCPHLGNFRAGAVGSLTSPTISAVSGGLATITGTVVIGLALPAFVRYGARPEPAADSVDQPEPVVHWARHPRPGERTGSGPDQSWVGRGGSTGGVRDGRVVGSGGVAAGRVSNASRASRTAVSSCGSAPAAQSCGATGTSTSGSTP